MRFAVHPVGGVTHVNGKSGNVYMQHDLHREGFGYRLRPVRIDDAAFIVELRSEKDRSRFLHPVSPRVEEQEDWIRQYLAREGDYYFVVEDADTGRPEGTISVYDVSAEKKCGEVGRWIIRPHSGASYASLVLAWQVAFEALRLESFYSRTLVDNTKVNTIVRFLGLTNRGILPEKVELGGVLYDMVEYGMTRTTWFERKDDLWTKVASLTRLLRGNPPYGQGNDRRQIDGQ